jgi:hypothetical protein
MRARAGKTSAIELDTGVFGFDHRFSPIFTENVEIDQEKSVKSVKSVVEMAYFGAESIFVRLQNRT